MEATYLLPDFARAMLAGALFAAFAAGAKAFGERLFSGARARHLPIWVHASLTLYALVFGATVLELANVPMLVPIAAGVIALQALGAFTIVRGRRLDLTAVALFSLVTLLWSYYTRDLASIASEHDGITHTAFILRFLDSGHVFLVKTPPAFAAIWPNGGETLRHYPCGTHAIAAAFLWPWTHALGVVSVASALKAFTALVPGLLAPMLLAAFRDEPRRATVVLVAALVATDPRFPVWALDSGGFSRAVGYLLILPLVWSIAALPLPLILAFAVPVAFALHPTSAAVLAIVAGGAFLLQRRASIPFFLAVATGLFLVFAQLHLTDSLGYASASVAKDAQSVVMSAREIRGHVLTLYKVMFFEASDARLGPIAFTDVLTVVGLAALARTRLPWLVFLALSLVAATKFAPVFALNAVGEIFYHNRERLTEAYFCMKPLIWMGALAVIERRVRRLPFRAAILGFLTTFLVGDKVFALRRTERHLSTQFASYSSPRYSVDEKLMEAIRRRTPRSSVLVYPPLSLDSVEARTGRRGFFMFQECPELNDTESCRRRLAAFARLRSECPSHIEELQILAASAAPVFLALPSEAPPPLCAQNQVVARESGFTLYRLRL